MSIRERKMKQKSKSVSPFSNQARNSYVIEHITDALLELLKDKPIGEISVSELCNLAEIGRVSFYRNFESKEEILKRYIRELFKEWTDEADKRENIPVSELLSLLFEHFEKHHDFYILLNDRNLLDLLKEVILEIYGPKPDNPKEIAYARAYYSYALYGWIVVWFQRGMKESAKEIAEMFGVQGL